MEPEEKLYYDDQEDDINEPSFMQNSQDPYDEYYENQTQDFSS